MILLIDRIIYKLQRIYWSKVFKAKSRNIYLANILGKVYLNATNLKHGKNLTLYPGVYFWGDGEIVIGDNVDIGIGTIIFSKKKISIGNNVSIAAQCYIIDSNHSMAIDKLINDQPLTYDENGIVIEDDVWIAAGSKILKGSKLSKGAVVGAMSLVNTLVTDNSIVAGIPAKVINLRK